MPARTIIITDANNYKFPFFVAEDDELTISVRDDYGEGDLDIAGIVNGSSGLELGTFDRDGTYVQRWHERSDS